jgi:hypothetical protein
MQLTNNATRPALAAALLAVALFATTVVARAQPSAADRAVAQTLYDEGKRLYAANDYVNACPKLAEAQRLSPSFGWAMNAGLCYQQQGLTASAWAAFNDAARLAKVTGDAKKEKDARDAVAQVEPTLMKVVVVVSAPQDALEVRRDGAVIGPAQFGLAMPVDPGEHVVEASAAGRQPFRTMVALVSAGTTQTVSIPMLLPLPPAPNALAPRGPDNAPFDRGAAAASLGAVAESVAACKQLGGPTGEGHVSVTFRRNGTVRSAVVDTPPYARTGVGGCITMKFRAARVPPYAGERVTVGKRFVIN